MDELANDTLSQLHAKMLEEALVKGIDDIHVGDIIYYDMDRADGLVLNGPYDSRLKYVVVSGSKSNHKEICAVLINSDKDYSQDPRWQNEQYCIRQADYPGILHDDSWIDCSDPKELLVKKLKAKKAVKCGSLNKIDLQNVMTHLKENGFVDDHIRKVYGIKEFKSE